MSTLDSENDSIFDEPWSLNDFKFGRPLGRGFFGHVFVAKENRTKYQHLVAIKIMFKKTLEKNGAIENFKRECQLHSTLKHPNVIGFYGWFFDDKRICYILEYAPHGNLFDLINDGPIKENLAATYVYQTAKGLIYIHSKNIIHRDLKPENLLIGNFNEIKIADFGWANITNGQEYMDIDVSNGCNSFAGTIDYLCPEIIQRIGQDKKVDVWCLGVLCYEMLVGSPPFYDDSNKNIFNKIINVKYKFPKSLNLSARNLISQLLVKNPANRMELTDVLNHKWIDSFADKDESYFNYYN